MEGGRQKLLASSEASREQKVIKLRVSYGGSFQMVRAAVDCWHHVPPCCVCFLALSQLSPTADWRGQPNVS